VLLGLVLVMGCATPVSKTVEPVPFCQLWNTLGNEPNGEPVTVTQRKMFHLGYFLSRSDFVRITLNEHFDNSSFVDKVITCYEENAMFLVDETDGVCACSLEDNKDARMDVFNKYINDCIREVKTEK